MKAHEVRSMTPDQRADQRVGQVVHGATRQGDNVTLSREGKPVFTAGCV